MSLSHYLSHGKLNNSLHGHVSSLSPIRSSSCNCFPVHGPRDTARGYFCGFSLHKQHSSLNLEFGWFKSERPEVDIYHGYKKYS